MKKQDLVKLALMGAAAAMSLSVQATAQGCGGSKGPQRTTTYNTAPQYQQGCNGTQHRTDNNNRYRDDHRNRDNNQNYNNNNNNQGQGSTNQGTQYTCGAQGSSQPAQQSAPQHSCGSTQSVSDSNKCSGGKCSGYSADGTRSANSAVMQAKRFQQK